MHVSEYLIDQGISQEDFAVLSGIPRSTIYAWVAGKNVPSAEHMVTLKRMTADKVTLEDCIKYAHQRMNELIPLEEAMRIMRVQRQTVMKAIRDKKLKSEKINKKWFTSWKSIEDYKKNKYNPEERTVGGRQIWNVAEGKISPQHAAKMLRVSLQTIYHMMRHGRIQSTKVNGFHVIDASEIEQIMNAVEDLRPLF